MTDGVLTTWLDRLFARNLWLDLGRKRPIPHESWFHRGRLLLLLRPLLRRAVHRTAPAGRAALYQDHLAQVLMPLQEQDGSWWDFPLYDYHQQYGTAFALMSLARCRKL